MVLKLQLSICAGGSLFFDTSSLTGKFAQIIQLSATYFTTFVHFDRIDVGRLDGEDTLYTYRT